MGEAESASRKERQIRLAVQCALTGPLLIACVFMVYLTFLVRRLTVTIEVMSEDLAQVMATTARVAEDVDRVEARIQTWYKSFGGAKVAGAVDELARMARGLTGETVDRSAAASEEVAYLISQVRTSKAKFEYAGREQSGMSLYARLYAKYKAYGNAITSAEDFIDKVASKSITGKAYHVTEPGGEKVELGRWLRAKLAAKRAGGE
ncbi:MAG: DUF5329 family protein [Planctomycetota bacterium]